MTRHPIHQPPTRPPAIVDRPGIPQLAGHQLADLTPAQQAELQALVTRAVAIATTQHLHRDTPLARDRQPAHLPLADPGVWIVLVMLALVALVAIVALGTVFGLSIIGA